MVIYLIACLIETPRRNRIIMKNVVLLNKFNCL